MDVEMLKIIKELYNETRQECDETTKAYNKVFPYPLVAPETRVARLASVILLLCKNDREEFAKIMCILVTLYKSGIIMIKD